LIRSNVLKIRKPYNRYLDECISQNNNTEINHDFQGWMQMSKLRKNTHLIDIRPINYRDRFLITLKKELQKDTRRSEGRKYAFYNIL